jgi:2,3-diketo-5-methylthio-1-phosphopentane phosphatase
VLDFDGTITEQDVGDKVVERFASPGWEEGVRRLVRGEWSVGKLQRWEAARLPAHRLREMVDFALRTARIRPGLRELVDFANARSFHIEVASAGFDFYVNAVLEREGFTDLEVVVPRFTFDEAGDPPLNPRLRFPSGVATCERVGLCKCDRLWRLQRERRLAVFVGDGISDQCPAGEADLLFARGSLARHCAAHGIGYVPYDDFFDVLAELEPLVA